MNGIDVPSTVPLLSGFDHSTDKALIADHFALWSRLRRKFGALRSDIAKPFGYELWYVLRYDDIVRALQDSALFSSRSVQPLGESPQRMIPEELDPLGGWCLSRA